MITTRARPGDPGRDGTPGRSADHGGADAQVRPVAGVIGLGTMGGAMARHLLAAGYEVVGYDVAAAQLAAFGEAGGTSVGSPSEVAARADVLVLSLPSQAAFEEVVAGPDGLTAQPSSRATIAVETSTLSLESKEHGRAQLAGVSIELLDCPISGTGAQMARGDAVFYLSGEERSAAAVEPLLAACGKAVFFLGSFGNGTRMKLVANHLVTIHNASAAEALVLARCGGIDPAVALPALVAGAGDSRMLEVRGPAMVAEEYEPPTMRVRTFLKDIGIIREFARSAGCVLPVFEAAAELHERARDAGWSEADPASVHAVIERRPPSSPARPSP